MAIINFFSIHCSHFIKRSYKIFLSALFACLLYSCKTTDMLTLTGDYPIINTTTTTDKTFDEVWDNVIDYFAINGIPISILDKESGLIVSNKVSLKNNITMEKNGKPLNDKAFIVIPYAKNVIYMNAYSDFNVRVKKQDGKITISVNLPNIVAERTTKPAWWQLVSTPKIVDAKSTGVFEKGLLSLLKQ